MATEGAGVQEIALGPDEPSCADVPNPINIQHGSGAGGDGRGSLGGDEQARSDISSELGGSSQDESMRQFMLAMQKVQVEAQKGMQRQMMMFQAKAMESVTGGNRVVNKEDGGEFNETSSTLRGWGKVQRRTGEI